MSEKDNPWERHLDPWEEDLALTYDVLDMIDVRGYVYRGVTDAYEIMRSIEGDYITGQLPKQICEFIDAHHDYFEYYVFNYMSEDDFLTYCRRRYTNFRYVEDMRYRIINI